MKTQIVYVLVANEKNLYLEELWVSIYSLRQFHPKTLYLQNLKNNNCAHVKVLVDEQTGKYIRIFPELVEMIDEIIVVPTPEGYNAKERSRQIKTTVRNIIDGAFLFIDTDTVICKPLNEIDNLTCNIAAVPDGHQPLSDYPFKGVIYNKLKNNFNTDITKSKYWYNSGVMYVADNEITRKFYKLWNENWTFSTFKKGDSQDQPALLKTNYDMKYKISELPDIYNCQVAMSLKYYCDAAIVHWWHMNFIKDQSYSPYLSLSIYRELKESKRITSHIDDLIKNCKSSFTPDSMPVGRNQMLFLFSQAGQFFNDIYTKGGATSWLMLKFVIILKKIDHFLNKK